MLPLIGLWVLAYASGIFATVSYYDQVNWAWWVSVFLGGVAGWTATALSHKYER